MTVSSMHGTSNLSRSNRSPRLIHTFFLNLVGMLTRNRVPEGVSTSCRLLPRPHTTYAHQKDSTATTFKVQDLEGWALSLVSMASTVYQTGNMHIRTLTIFWSPLGTTHSSRTPLVTCFLLVAFDIMCPPMEYRTEKKDCTTIILLRPYP